jgi:hypothetical protein
MTITQITRFGDASASDSTLFNSVAASASLRTSPRLWTQAKIAEQLTGASLSSATSSLYSALQTRYGADYFSHSSFDSTSEEALTLWPILSNKAADFTSASKKQFQAIADQAQSALTILEQGGSNDAPAALRKTAAEMYQSMKTISIISDLTDGTYTTPRSYHGRAFSA